VYTSASYKRIGRWLDAGHRMLFDHPAGSVGLGAACFILYAGFSLDLTFLHDEGIFTFDTTKVVFHSPAAVLFALKIKPVLTLIYAPFALMGLTPFLLLHAALAALAVVLVCRTAVHLKVAHPNAAGWLLALSMGFTVAASNGFANADGAFFLSLFLFLYFSKRYTWAALVLGLLPFVRNELALIWVGFLVWDVWNRKDYRFVLACLAFPVAYTLAGALYHHNLFWLVSYFPNPQDKPYALGFEPLTLSAMGVYFHQSLLINFGLLAFPALFAWKAGDRQRIFLLVLTWVMFVTMAVMQYYHVFGFNDSLRYHVAPLPLVALLCAFGLSSSDRVAWIGAGCLALLMLGFSVLNFGFSWYLAVLMLVVAVLAVARLLSTGLVRPANLVLWCAGVCVLISGLIGEWYGSRQHRSVHDLVARLKDSGLYSGQPLYTDLHILRHDRCTGVEDTYLLANEAIVWEFSRFTNHENGQYRDLVRAFEHQRFLVEAEAHQPRRDALYLLGEGPRMDRWRKRLEQADPQSVSIGEHRVYYWPRGGS
jgi:hypothetical protein